MYYNIDKKELKRKFLKSCIGIPTSDMMHDLYMYKEILEILKDEKEKNNIITKKSLSLSKVSKLLKETYNIFKTSKDIEIFNKLNDFGTNFFIEPSELDNITFNPDELKTISHDFFKYYNKEYLKLFNFVFSGKSSFINFRKMSDSDTIFGSTYRFKRTPSFYININLQNNVNDLIVFVHELIHVFNYLKYYYYFNVQYEETATLTAELYLIDYLKNIKFDIKNNIDFKKFELSSLSYLSHNIYSTNTSYQFLEQINKRNFNKDTINEFIEQINEWNKDSSDYMQLKKHDDLIKFFSELDLRNSDYNISQIIAYDLFLNGDKEASLDEINKYLNFKKIYTPSDAEHTNQKILKYSKTLSN